MKKTKLLAKLLFVFITPFYASCSLTNKKSFNLYADFTLDDKHVTYCIGDYIVPFNYEDYGIDKLIVGDVVDVSYKGEWTTLDSNSRILDTNKVRITKVEVTHGTAAIFEVVNNPGGGKSITAKDPNTYKYDRNITYCINEYDGYRYVSNCTVGTKLYGIIPFNSEDNVAVAFYDYNPLS